MEAFGTWTMVDVLRHVGTVACDSEMLKMPKLPLEGRAHSAAFCVVSVNCGQLRTRQYTLEENTSHQSMFDWLSGVGS